MCHTLPMQADGIIRLSKIEVYPEYRDEYLRYATEVGDMSLCTELGVLTMYAVAEKDNPCDITILETYASEAAYKSHIASPHFQKYKQGTLHIHEFFCMESCISSTIINFVAKYQQTE